MSNITLIGLDLAKNIFQSCGLNKAKKIIFNRKVKRNKLIEKFTGVSGGIDSHGGLWLRSLLGQAAKDGRVPG